MEPALNDQTSAAPCLLKRREQWLAHLKSERRVADKTLEAYERDLRQFCHHLTHHLGHPPRREDFADLKPVHLRGYLSRRRQAGHDSDAAGSRPYHGRRDRR